MKVEHSDPNKPTTKPCFHCIQHMKKHCPKIRITYKYKGVWQTRTLLRMLQDDNEPVAVSSAKARWRQGKS